MAMNEEVLKSMDDAAEVAGEKLKELDIDHVRSVAIWWKDNYLKSGHKRLAKLLLTYVPKKESY